MSTALLGFIILVLLVIVVFQISKITDFTNALKGDKEAGHEVNGMQGILLLIMMVVGMPILVWNLIDMYPQSLNYQGAASEHGPLIDSMVVWTTFWTGIVFIITQVLLFWYAYRYRDVGQEAKAYWFPHNTKLEVLWTGVPAIVLTILVVMGVQRWRAITGPAPKESMIIEATGLQFAWTIRYSGEDGELGAKNFRLIDEINTLGQDWTDKANHDDLIVPEMHLPVNQPVLVKIHARDVLHSFYLPHMRVKMDAVPGMPTQFWFTPKYTTDEFREMIGNPDFNYELACAELCGRGHFSMAKILVVDTQEDYEKWLSEQKPFYKTSVEGTDADTAGDLDSEEEIENVAEDKEENKENNLTVSL